MKKNYFMTLLFLCGFQLLFAQQQHYQLEKLEQPYTPLTQPTVIAISNWEEFADQIDYAPIAAIPFDFTLFGNKIDSLYFEMGALYGTFEKDNRHYISILHPNAELIDIATLDPNAAIQSQVSTQLEGNIGNRIFKIQVSNAGSLLEFDEKGTLDMTVNYQIWLYETTNEVEYRYGSNTITKLEDFIEDAIIYCGLGELNYKLNVFGVPVDFVQKTSLLDGDSDAPLLATDNPDVFLIDYPREGTVYKFKPGNLSVEKPRGTLFSAYPNPTEEFLNLSGDLGPNPAYSIFNMHGKKVQNGSIDNAVIDVSRLTPGTYLLHFHNNGQTIKFIKK